MAPMPEALPDPNRAPKFSFDRFVRSTWAEAFLVAIAAAVVFGYDLASEPHFVDESAYFSQSFYWRVFVEQGRNDPVWLDFPAYDLPPLPKYMIGAALAVAGYKTPGPLQASRWYADTSSRFEPPGALTTARVPFVAVGVIGCLAIYGIGVVLDGRAAGLVAASLLMVNPLYHTHARRAMSDVPCEAFILVSLFFTLAAGRRFLSGRPVGRAWGSAALAGLGVGLALLSKLSGSLAPMVIIVWVGLAWLLPGSWLRKVAFTASAVLAGVVSAGLFVAMNPYLTANPTHGMPDRVIAVSKLGFLERARKLPDLRLHTARQQQIAFPHNALLTAYDKISTTAVQGFGRFGPLGPSADDSTRRYELRQDWGGFVWLPLVIASAVWAALRGRVEVRAGEVPTAWAVLVYFVVALTVVTAYVPMAWDRYFLPIQAPAVLLFAGMSVALGRRLIRVFGGKAEASAA